MITITAKDRIFVLLAAPLAVLACYWFFIRAPKAREEQKLEAALSEMGDPETLMRQGDLLKQRLATVETLWDKTESEQGNESAGGLSPSSDPAVRLQKIVDVLQAQSVRVLRSEWIDPSKDAMVEPDAAVTALRKAGALERPDCWNLELESPYASFVRALSLFRTNDLPVVPLSVSMDARGRANGCRWRVKLWL